MQHLFYFSTSFFFVGLVFDFRPGTKTARESVLADSRELSDPDHGQAEKPVGVVVLPASENRLPPLFPAALRSFGGKIEQIFIQHLFYF